MTLDGVIFRLTKLIGKERALRFIRARNERMRKTATTWHRRQQLIEWGMPPTPEWFDHNLDVYRWHETRNPQGMERGVFNLLALKEQGKLLEICCGDGFNAYHFYGIRMKEIAAVDFDPEVIEHARRLNQASNIRYNVCDIREGLPEGPFDNVVWDMGIEHFTPTEIAEIMTRIKGIMTSEGILSGCTIAERAGGKQLVHHEYEFKSKEDLLRFFTPHFRTAKVFETFYPNRQTLYFYASDGILPFDPEWAAQVSSEHKSGWKQTL